MPSRTSPNKGTPWVDDDGLHIESDGTSSVLSLDSSFWFAWLEEAKRFYVKHPCGNFFCRKEARRRGGMYWSAYRRFKGQAYHTYIGSDEDCTRQKLEEVARYFAQIVEGEKGVKRGKRITGPPQVKAVREDGQTLWFDLADGRMLGAPIEWFPRLANATGEQRANWRIIGESGVHWPDVDEDISVRVLMNLPS